MEPELNLPGSPFAPSASGGPRSPFRAPPEAPRLGILHLMVWTACTAVHLGWLTTLMQLETMPEAPGPGTMLLLLQGSYSIVAGAALGGLLLWLARCWRRFPFLVHPGEYLLVVLGLLFLMNMVFQSAWWLPVFAGDPSGWPFSTCVSATLIYAIPMLVGGLIFLWPAIRVKSLGWRLYFALAAASCLFVGCWRVVSESTYLWRFDAEWSRALPLAVLLVVVARDHTAGRRYPWTHWAGVAAAVWDVVTQLVWLVVMIVAPLEELG